MTTLRTLGAATRPAPTPQLVLWTRVARTHVDALVQSDDTVRAAVVGSAGSGKSTVLRHLRRELDERGIPVVSYRASLDLRATPAESVLLVDDAHLLDDAQLEALEERIDDFDAATVLAARPWPQTDALRKLVRTLEQARPPIVLGHVTHADVRSRTEATGTPLSGECIDAILELTGGVSWLVAEAIAVHDGPCDTDAGRRAIADELQDVIAHRLRTIDSEVSEQIEIMCLAEHAEWSNDPLERDDLLLAGYAEGLLQRNGQPVPVVRSAVRATMSVERLIHLSLASLESDHGSLHGVLDGVRHPRVAAALLAQGDARLAHGDARGAAELYLGAKASGADAATVAIRQAQTAWALGDIDAAGAFLDGVDGDTDESDHERRIDTAAAVWAARGLIDMSAAVYRTADSRTLAIATHAAVAALANADRETVLATEHVAPARSMPSTLTVATDFLAKGVRGTLTGTAHGALQDLVRASEMYSASGTSAPVPELPAVIAALAAIHLGELDVAQTVLDDALRAQHGGAWARDRLTLWRAWVALQLEHPHEAEASLQQVTQARTLSPRDRLLADAVMVGLARRFSDSAGVVAAWRKARETVLRAQFDLFSLLPLCEYVVTAARVGDADRMQGHFAAALEQMQRLGSPALWSAHLHWAGIQQGISLNRAAELKPHARELIATAAQNPLAATMAQAGRVWTQVLAGSIDPDAVEAAAYALASVGLAWDGARLAGHGAGRSDDRRVITRLLACARQLHPREESRVSASTSGVPAPAPTERPNEVLSAREREVAVLVLQGKTYTEIGESIFISPRTAEHHIARIRRRLGATTRSDLIGKLRGVLDADPLDAANPQDPASAALAPATPDRVGDDPYRPRQGFGDNPDARSKTNPYRH